LQNHARLGISLHVYNEATRIRKCIESLKRQDCNFLCVISDNYSTDGTYELLSEITKDDHRFVLIRQAFHVSQMQNFVSCVEFLLGEYYDFDFIMHFAADDVLVESTYLTVLQSAMIENPKFQVIAPKMLLKNAQSGKCKEIELSNLFRSGIVRIFTLALSSSNSGKFNFVSSLMSKSAFREWFDMYYASSKIDNQEVNSRAINSEFIAMFHLLKKYRIASCPDVTYLKEVHNRDGLVKRTNLVVKVVNDKSKRHLLAHQIRSYLIPLRASAIASKLLSTYDLVLFILFGITYFITHLTQLSLNIVKSRFLFLKVNL
jgi:glycosyltransferase involved in cell wall biosynthesis